jgi:arsenate reductase
MKVRLYGIRNCDTVKKARAWLDAKAVDVDFHDFRSAGVSPELLASWLARTGWQTLFNRLVNRRGLTWKKLPEIRRQQVVDAQSAIALMLESPTVIKRPVLVAGSKLLVGFDTEEYASLCQRSR